MLNQLAGIPPAPDSGGLIRFQAVKDLSGLSRSTVDRLEKAGQFPHRVLISPNAVAWHRFEVLNWIQSRRGRQ